MNKSLSQVVFFEFACFIQHYQVVTKCVNSGCFYLSALA